MDVGELLSFKPATAPKRPAPVEEHDEPEDDDDPTEPYEMRAAKRRKAKKVAQRRYEEERMAALEMEAAAALGAARGEESAGADHQSAIQEHVDSIEGDTEPMDDNKIKRMILNFEKRSTKNQELRIKFPDEPAKFMASEMELHDAIQELRSIATVPDQYPILVDLQSISSLLGLLSHENADISVAVVDLLQELTDVDTLHESVEGTAALVQSLSENQVCAMLVQNLDRLNDNVREESDGIHNTLSVIENLVEFRPEISKEAAEAGLLLWLMKRLKVKVPFDNNKLYASEILSILLQNEPENRKTFGELSSSIDSLLQQLAYYKRHNPNTEEEQEMMENLFDCLCSLLLHVPNRERFLKGEGLQLMNLMLREKKVSRNGALKVLDHALIGPEGKDCCNKFVEILGLRTIFPLFMKTPTRHRRKGVTVEEHEEHVISILTSLLKNCRGPQRQRLLGKFTESDHEKVERLMELHFKYLDKVQETEERLREIVDQGEEDLDEDEMYMRRLAGGLFSLQLVDYIVVDACASGAPSIKQRVHQILNQRKASVKTIRNIVREYAGNIGDVSTNDVSTNDSEENGDEKEQEKQHLLHLVDKF